MSGEVSLEEQKKWPIWICVGKRMGQEKGKEPKLFSGWVPKDNPDSDVHFVTFKKIPGWPGQQYHMKVDGRNFQIGPYAGLYEDKERCAEWQARAQADAVAIRARKEEREAKHTDWMATALAPLSQAYRQSDPIGRQVILARAISLIMKGTWG